MTSKERIRGEFKLYSLPGGGIGSWLTEKTDAVVFERLSEIETNPLSTVQLDQLLLLSLEAGVSAGFFDYYWREVPDMHPYAVRTLPGFHPSWLADGRPKIMSREHLKWGLPRMALRFGSSSLDATKL